MILVDANVIVYRFVHGPLTAQADGAVRKDSDWRTSALWKYEFTNAVSTMLRNKVLDEASARSAVAAADSEMSPRELDLPQAQALSVARRYGVSGYDAQYVALAEMLGVRCVTADAALARKTAAVSTLLGEFIR